MSETPTTNKEQAQQVAAAELLGWTHRSGVMEYDGEKMPFTIWSKDGNEVGGDRMPNFHTDANASLQLIEWMKEKGWSWEIRNSNGGWLVLFYSSEQFNSGKQFKTVAGIGETFQLSILHAFLRANEREDLI